MLAHVVQQGSALREDFAPLLQKKTLKTLDSSDGKARAPAAPLPFLPPPNLPIFISKQDNCRSPPAFISPHAPAPNYYFSHPSPCLFDGHKTEVIIRECERAEEEYLLSGAGSSCII